MGGEAAQAEAGHGVAHGIKPAHAGQAQGEADGEGEENVDQPKVFGGLGNAGGKFAVFVDAGDFGFEKLGAAHTDHGQDGYGQNDDAHAAYPIEQVAPEIERGGKAVEVGENGGAGGGEAGDGFEEGVGVADAGQIPIKWHGSNHGKPHPQQKNEGETVAGAQLTLMAAGDEPDDAGHADGGGGGIGKHPEGGVLVEIRHERGRQEQQRKHEAEAGEDVDDGGEFVIHGVAVSGSLCGRYFTCFNGIA